MIKYTVKSFLRPSIVDFDTKSYIVPAWIEVPLGTTLEQIDWIPVMPMSQADPNVMKVTGSKGDIYHVRRQGNAYFCDCMGFSRLKTEKRAVGCKHIQYARKFQMEQLK